MNDAGTSGGQASGRDDLLVVHQLRRDFGGVVAVADTSFTVREHSITGLIGPNGAGKSTVVSIIAGSVKPSSGKVYFRGEDIAGHSPHEIASAGITRTFQSISVFEGLTVMENLLVGAKADGGESLRGALIGGSRWRRAEQENVVRARSLLGRFGLTAKESQLAGSLSGGERRLVEITRALMAEPALLLLDEPFSGVSPPMISRVAEQIDQLRVDGLTVLMVEHELAMVEQLCATVIVMARGSVLGEGTMTELRTRRDVVGAYIG